tara:strand:+ start:10936 stop:11478 length:543 start_codon:yes stop_codon:yes gene_type:complete
MAIVTTAVVATIGVGIAAQSAHNTSEYQDAQMDLSEEQLQAQRERNERLKGHWTQQESEITTAIDERSDITAQQEDIIVDQYGGQKNLQDLKITRQTENTFSQIDNIKSKSGFATSDFMDNTQGQTIADMMAIQQQESIDAQNELQQSILNIKTDEMSEIAELEERGDVLEEKIAGLTEV